MPSPPALTSAPAGDDRMLIYDKSAGKLSTIEAQYVRAGLQASTAVLTALGGLTTAADKLPYFTGVAVANVCDFTSVARTLVGQTTQALMRSAGLGLGTSAVVDTGTSGTKVPLLDGANSWSGAQTFLNSSGVKILDTDASHTLGLVGGSNLTANRTLTLTTGDASRTLTINGDATIPAGTLVADTRSISNGYGITGGGNLSADRTLAVSLTTAEAFIATPTTISASTYADITGASITLAAGTWLILGFANFSSVNAQAILDLAITDGSNNVLAEGCAGVPASGTANVAQVGNVHVSAIVTPSGSTTYKLRGARGTTTITGTVVVMDGADANTTNNLTDNTDKGTSIRAIRVA